MTVLGQTLQRIALALLTALSVSQQQEHAAPGGLVRPGFVVVLLCGAPFVSFVSFCCYFCCSKPEPYNRFLDN